VHLQLVPMWKRMRQVLDVLLFYCKQML